MDSRSHEIVAQVALKEAFTCIYNCPVPTNEGDPFRSPVDVVSEALLLTKTILKGFVDVMAYFEEIDPTPKRASTPDVEVAGIVEKVMRPYFEEVMDAMSAARPPAQSAAQKGKTAPAQSSTEEHICPEHGAMEFREGVSSKTGKPYSGWFCSDRDCRTKPIFTTVR